ncbi:MAG TPA: hypothetical protein VEA99_18110 [Gemmatimonadaceae bacterium]|nr:hypothetical protein [Gemmatimonadaceae bacterium]
MRSSRRRIVWLLPAVAASCLASRGGDATSVRLRVEPTTTQALPVPRGSTLRWPTAAWHRDGWVVAANVFPNDDRPVPRRALYLVHQRQGALPLPPGDFLFAYPDLIVDRAQRLHLFWAEAPPGSRALIPGWPIRHTQLWQATLRDGAWDTPRLVLEAEQVVWEGGAPRAALDAEGRLHLLVIVHDSTRLAAIVHLRHEGERWRQHETGLNGASAAIVAIGPELLVAYARGITNGPSNQLFTASSMDGGDHWGPSVRVVPAALLAQAHHPRLHVADGRVHLSWYSDEAEGPRWHAAARRADRGWSPPRSSDPLGDVLFRHTLIAPCGTPVGVVDVARVVDSVLVPAIRTIEDSAGTLIVRRPLGDAPAMSATIAHERGRGVLIWSGPAPAGDFVAPFLSVLPGCR